MKKTNSCQKILAKTNITVTQTHNININSPKAIGINNMTSSKKLFKSHNSKKDAFEVNCQQSKYKFEKKVKKQPTKSKRFSSGEKGMKIEKQQSSFDKDSESQNKKEEIKKLEEKLKELQKKISQLKIIKKKKKEQSPTLRNQSKIKEEGNHSKINYEQRPSSSTLIKKRGSSSKLLKKSQSDKHLIKKIKKRKQNYKKTQQSELNVMHKFITQVKNDEDKQMSSVHYSKKNCVYYIENIVNSLRNNWSDGFRQHLVQSHQTFHYLKNLRKPSLKQLQKHNLHIEKKSKKPSLILDLDQTLIHCNESLSIPHDITLSIKFPTGQKIQAGINIRPYAKELLEQLSEYYQIIVFTASHECYANVVLDNLDPKGQFINHRLFRNNCWQTEEGVYIKDLRVLKNRELQNVLLVDNAAYSYFFQPQNGIPILPFYDDKNDLELLSLCRYLKWILKVQENKGSNLSLINKRYFHLERYFAFNDIDQILEYYQKNMEQYKKTVF